MTSSRIKRSGRRKSKVKEIYLVYKFVVDELVKKIAYGLWAHIVEIHSSIIRKCIMFDCSFLSERVTRFQTTTKVLAVLVLIRM